MKEILLRLKSDTPKFWKRVQYVAFAVGLVAAAIFKLPMTTASIKHIAEHVGAMCPIIILIAQLACGETPTGTYRTTETLPQSI